MKLSLCLLWLTLSSFASQRESYLDLISKAQNLSLQHDRLQAAQILTRAIKADKPGTPSYKQLRLALETLSELFYTEKAQKIFALGVSLEDPRQAADKFDEALSLEPGHTGILRAMARVRLRSQDCEGALKAVDQALSMNPFSPSLILVRIQALQCAGDFQTARGLFAVEGVSHLSPAYETALLRDLISQKRWLEARRKIKDLETKDPAYPELFYYLSRIHQQLHSTDLSASEQYVQACQKKLPSLRKKYDIEPSLCTSVQDVENELRQKRADEGIQL